MATPQRGSGANNANLSSRVTVSTRPVSTATATARSGTGDEEPERSLPPPLRSGPGVHTPSVTASPFLTSTTFLHDNATLAAALAKERAHVNKMYPFESEAEAALRNAQAAPGHQQQPPQQEGAHRATYFGASSTSGGLPTIQQQVFATPSSSSPHGQQGSPPRGYHVENFTQNPMGPPPAPSYISGSSQASPSRQGHIHLSSPRGDLPPVSSFQPSPSRQIQQPMYSLDPIHGGQGFHPPTLPHFHHPPGAVDLNPRYQPDAPPPGYLQDSPRRLASSAAVNRFYPDSRGALVRAASNTEWQQRIAGTLPPRGPVPERVQSPAALAGVPAASSANQQAYSTSLDPAPNQSSPVVAATPAPFSPYYVTRLLTPLPVNALTGLEAQYGQPFAPVATPYTVVSSSSTPYTQAPATPPTSRALADFLSRPSTPAAQRTASPAQPALPGEPVQPIQYYPLRRNEDNVTIWRVSADYEERCANAIRHKFVCPIKIEYILIVQCAPGHARGIITFMWEDDNMNFHLDHGTVNIGESIVLEVLGHTLMDSEAAGRVQKRDLKTRPGGMEAWEILEGIALEVVTSRGGQSPEMHWEAVRIETAIRNVVHDVLY